MRIHFRACIAFALSALGCAAGPPSFAFSPTTDASQDASQDSGAIRLLGNARAPGSDNRAPAHDAYEQRVDSPLQTEARADAAPDGSRAEEASCTAECGGPAAHLLISEIVTRPHGAEMIELLNPTTEIVDLSNYWISDSHLYDRVAADAFPTASGSDFAARFPGGAIVGPREYRTVALGNASGGSASFAATYGKSPDFELRPSANGASDDPAVPNMLSSNGMASIGATASLTDAGEPVILFYYARGLAVRDVDYVYYGAPSASNPVVDKTSDPGYSADTPAALQHAAPAPDDGGSLQRCDLGEPGEARTNGNGLSGHDETSEDSSRSFVLTTSADMRTPGRPPPPGVCP
jgi:hypothetical protein